MNGGIRAHGRAWDRVRGIMAPARAAPLVVVAVAAAMLVPGARAHAQAAVPAQPAGLSVSASTHDSVTLAWDDPGDASITGYQVLRRSRDGSSYGDGEGAAVFVAVVDDTGSATTSYADTSVTAHTRYVYRVKARNAAGLSPQSSYVNAETAEAPVVAPTPVVEPVVASTPVVEPAPEPACPGGSDPPTPTEVVVTAVPIVVASTTADYFVLYASHDLDGTTVEYPVLVALGEDGTTTLAENVEALPTERYRVEKYLIADPGDVDGDCIDDITELDDLGVMNPVNPADAVELTQGAVAVPDRATFRKHAYPAPGDERHLKIVITDIDTDRPSVYFQNASEFPGHGEFLNHIGVGQHDAVRGLIVYDPELVAPDGSRGVFRYRIQYPTFSFSVLHRQYFSFSSLDRIHTLLAASMPLLDDNLALWIPNQTLTAIQADLSLYRASRISLVFDDDVNGDTTFLALNPGEGFGLLRGLDADERPGSRDVVIYEALPNELPRVAGIISTVAQTPLSHVNLRALQDGVPNAFIAGALEDETISGLIDSYVYYAVTDAGYTIRAATQSEVDEHYASSRPAEAQTPQRDLTVTSVTALSGVGFEDWDAFGVKAANVAVLGTLGFVEGTVPDGFAVPFYFYDEFMKHNDLYSDIEEMLADSDFQADYDTKVDELKKLRKKIKKAQTPEWIETALTAMHATFAEGTSLRYRSSTNNEDLPNFNGAGLYDSKTQHPDETTEDGIAKSLKQVYASLWNFRAFIERDFHRVDHMAAAMGVLVHPNYSDERVNGVAVSADPAYGTDGTHYVNSQVGEDLVTNPEAHSVPEEILLYPDDTYSVVALSNQVPAGQLLMTDDQLGQLRRHLAAIHEKFEELYAIEDGERFAIEIEFKITSDNILAIKQARPWIFTDAPDAIVDTLIEDPLTSLTASFDNPPATHDGNPFSFEVEFSDIPSVGFVDFRDHAVAVTGGTVTIAHRVDGRDDRWAFHVTPDSHADVAIVLPENVPCTIPGAICSMTGRRLSTRLELTVEGPLPRVVDRPTGQALSSGVVELEWNDVRGADSYEVQFLHDDEWLDLPADGIEIVFDGSGAVVSGLRARSVNDFRVRAANSLGVSAWSAQLLLPMGIEAVLEAELSAGRQTGISPVASGYSILGDLGGTLTPGSFVLEGTTYKVKFLTHLSESLWLGLDREPPSDFTLRVGDSDYRGSESTVPVAAGGAGQYWWPAESAGWTGDDPVEVVLLVHSGVALGDRQKAPVTGYFSNFASDDDGSSDFSFRIYFSEGVNTTADAMRDDVLSVAGGAVSSVDAVGAGGRIWAVSVRPESSGTVSIGIDADLDCELPEAICTGDGRRLFNRMELMSEGQESNLPRGATIDGYLGVGVSHRLMGNIEGANDIDCYRLEVEAGATYTISMEGTWTGHYGISNYWVPVGTLHDPVIEGIHDSRGHLIGGTGHGGNHDRGQGLNDQNTFSATNSTTNYVCVSGQLNWTGTYRITLVRDQQPAQNNPATGAPTISGTPQVAETLTASTSGVSDTDGLDNATFSYQWQANDATADSDIGGATSSTYTIQTADVGKTIKVRVSFTDDADNNETLTSAATAAVTAAPTPNSAATGAPTISGTPQVAETLTASTSGVSDADGLDNATFRYQWQADDTNISEATDATYTLADADEGKTIKVRVSFTDDADNNETLTSAATAAVTAAPTPNSAATGAPTISGTPQVAETLTASTSGVSDADGLDNATFRYQWQADDTNISEATDATYTLADADEGKTIKVRVSFTDDADNNETLTSAATAAVTAAPTPNSAATGAPTISGTPQVAETLTASTSGVSDADGLDNATFRYQWQADDTNISEATDATYTLADADEGKTIKVRVSFTDDADNNETLTSAATAVVTAGPTVQPPAKPAKRPVSPVQPPAKPAKPAVSSASHDSVTIAWDDPGDSSITGYQILRREPAVHDPGVFPVLVNDTATAATSYTDTAVTASTQYVYRVKAINAAGLSPQSSYANAETPTAPGPPRRPDHESLNGEATGEGTGSLDWADVSEADSYDVQFWDRDLYDWVVLSAGANSNGITLTFNGSSATVSGLPEGYSEYWFNVRSRNAHGVSQWPGNNIRFAPYQPPA